MGERQITFSASGFVDRDPDFSPYGRTIVVQREGEASTRSGWLTPTVATSAADAPGPGVPARLRRRVILGGMQRVAGHGSHTRRPFPYGNRLWQSWDGRRQ